MRFPRLASDVAVTINIIKDKYRREKEPYFDDPACPYTKETKDLIRTLVGNIDDAVENIFEEEGAVEIEVLDVQIQKILSRMDKMERELGGLEPNERLNFFKTRAALAEKLITLREKVDNLRTLGEFKSVVVSILEDVCDADQIAEFRKRLGGVGVGVGA